MICDLDLTPVSGATDPEQCLRQLNPVNGKGSLPLVKGSSGRGKIDMKPPKKGNGCFRWEQVFLFNFGVIDSPFQP